MRRTVPVSAAPALLAPLVLLAPAVFAPFTPAITPPVAFAQGLVWSLPDDGTWVRHEGTYRQTDINLRNEEREFVWTRHLTIRSVGTATVDHDGRPTACRILEFEVETGTAGEGFLDPGAAGRLLYKVWVPENAVSDSAVDGRGVPRSALKVARGYVQFSEEQPVALRSDALRLYPTVTLLTDYDPSDIEKQDAAPVDLPIGTVTATRYAASQVLETPSTRTTNKATLFVSPDVPFGPARWSVTLDRERKDASVGRDAFRVASRIAVEMEATATGTDAVSELDAE